MKKQLLVLVMCTFVAAPALADMYPTIDVKETSVSPSTVVQINSSMYDGGTYAGIYNLGVKNASDPVTGHPEFLGNGTSTVYSIESFCIDVWDYSPTSFVQYYVKPLDQAPDPGAGPMGPTRAAYLAQLLDNYWVVGMTNTDKTALQLAVWEVVDENLGGSVPAPGTFSVATGTFKVTVAASDVIARANTMLGSITAGGAPYVGKYAALSNSTTNPAKTPGTYQDYVVRVPVPGAVLLGVLGLSVAGARLRKRS